MNLFLYILTSSIELLLSAIGLCFLVRAILSWFPVSEDNPILLFSCFLTEPFIIPVRKLFEKMNWFQNSPLDVSYIFGWLFFSLLDTLLFLFV